MRNSKQKECRIVLQNETYLVRWKEERICDSIAVYRVIPNKRLFNKQHLTEYMAPILAKYYELETGQTLGHDDDLIRLANFAVQCYIQDEARQAQHAALQKRQLEKLNQYNAKTR